MADFLDSEASESDNSENEDLDPHERRKLKKIKAVSDSEEEDEDDEDRIREELKDLIDDNPIDDDEESDANSDTSRREKRKGRSDDELDDRLEDDDYDLLEENLGVKVQRRKRFKRLKRALEDSDAEGEEDADREAIANQLFDDEDEESRRSVHSHSRIEADDYDEIGEDEESDADDFIVDDDGRPITEKRKKARRIFNDANLQEGQDIFGVDFDYDEFEKYGDEDYAESESEEDYEDDDVDGEREKRPKKVAKKKTSRKSIFEIYEPSELKRGHFTDVDNEIRKTDIPERMQLRDIPITAVPENSNELEDEAEWIYKQAFTKSTISNRSEEWTNGDERKPSSAIGKIKQALDFMRNQQLEVPFIAFYRKEYVQPELNINDLWKVYQYDAKWCQLLTRKKALATLFEKMRNFQLDQIISNSDGAIPDDVRLINDNDIERLHLIQTPEELRDVHNHFLLHYAHEIPAMQQAWRQKEKEKRRTERLEVRRKQLESLEEGAELPAEIPEEDDDIEAEETLKSARDSGPYSMCRKSGILGLAKRFGLTPEQFAENLRDNYQRHDVEQEPLEPTEVAREYVSKRFQTVDEILHAVKFVVARQISREPMLRKSVRETYYERAKISVVPTKKGQKEIDENHPIYALKYLKDKPVRDLVGDQFLKLSMADEDKLITLTISETIDGHNSSSSYLEDVKQFYQRDEFSKNVQEWNALRASCVEEAIVKMVLPDLRKELRSILLAEAKENVLAACAQKLCGWIKPAPYTVVFPEEDEEDWDTTKGVRVCGFAFDDDPAQASFCAIINPEGEVTDYLRLSKFASRRGKLNIDEEKDPDTFALVNFLRTKKPHVIVIGGESLKALKIQRDLQEIITFLVDEEQFPKIAIEIINNDLAKIYANSKKSNADFREYPIILRQAISVARRLQDPLIEYSQLCTTDEEILCLRYHPLQDQLPKEDLLEVLNLEFVNRTNEVGVDVNLAVQNSLTSNLVQFVCGLGPRKGQALLKILKQTNQRLENRTQLVTHCHMGPRVFINCSGFIKIDTNSLGDSTETYVEVLDGSRVHPETYEWARKMAVDALEYDDEDDANPAGALEEILESPERLKDLDLDAFAVELERQGFGNKSITLYDIRNELNSRYKDLRPPYRSPSREELFEILAKETPATFYVGKFVLAKVIGFVHRKPQGDQLDNADPEENAETGLWKCPFCLKNDFPDLSEVWNHFDAGACPGQASGIRVLLENGVTGFIHLKNLSDKHVKHPEERVQIGQAIHCRIIKIDPERFSVDCSSKSSDLLDRNGEWRPKKDHYYDEDLEEKETKRQDENKKQAARQQYTRRIIVHPAFHNKSYKEAIKIMATMDQGEVIIRPSSKGSDHLTVTWKVCDEIYQHIDVREEGKENAFSLGSSLWIGNDEFEDLDEIIARHVTPMAAYARDLLGYKYYRDSAGGMEDKMEEILKEEKKKNANKIHYFISALKNYPGKFLLSYLPRGKIRHEYVSVTPEGFRFRQQMFDSLNSLLKWFKEHFKDPIPTATPAVITPRSVTNSTRSSFATPALSQSSIASDAINKVARNMPSHMLHSLTQVANKTPHYPHTPGYGGQSSYVNTPYTPSGQTPFMTPYQTPHHAVQTPRYGQATPSNSNSNGTFAQPRPPQSSRAPRSSQYHQSNHAHSKNAQQWSNQRPQSAHRSSPHVPSPRNRYTPTHGSRSHHSSYQSHHSKNPSSSNNDDDDWEKGSASWEAASRNRQSKKSSAAPATSYDDDWDDGPNNWEAQVSSKATPRSVRSTPRTDTSPRSMTLGDATPLYDENI